MRPPADCKPGRRSTALAAVLIAIGLASSAMPAGAASIGPVSEVSVEEPHSCPCGMDCKGKCCCAGRSKSKRAETPSKPEGPEAASKAEPAGTCVSPAPCGGAVPPQSTRSLTLGDPAWLGLSDRISPASLGEPLAPRPDRDWQVPVLVPVDDPPEGLR